MKRIAAGLIPLVVLGSAACQKEAPPPPPPPPSTTTTTLPAPVSVGAVTLGNAIGEDKRVSAPMEAFGAKDTIYASVETAGVGHAKLRALWTYVRGEQTAKVDETTIELDATAPTVNEFHVAKPSGWPKGDYKVEIYLNDATTPAATKTFKVG
jgi:hypothetical protein